MDPTRFDRLAIAVAQQATRRAALGLLTALGLTGLVPEAAAAVCRSPGAKCTRATAAACCSGICKGPQGKKTCRCPQRTCCQCTKGAGTPVACGFVSGQTQCETLCASHDAESALVLSQAQFFTTVCRNDACDTVNCRDV